MVSELASDFFLLSLFGGRGDPLIFHVASVHLPQVTCAFSLKPPLSHDGGRVGGGGVRGGGVGGVRGSYFGGGVGGARGSYSGRRQHVTSTPSPQPDS